MRPRSIMPYPSLDITNYCPRATTTGNGASVTTAPRSFSFLFFTATRPLLLVPTPSLDAPLPDGRDGASKGGAAEARRRRRRRAPAAAAASHRGRPACAQAPARRGPCRGVAPPGARRCRARPRPPRRLRAPPAGARRLPLRRHHRPRRHRRLRRRAGAPGVRHLPARRVGPRRGRAVLHQPDLPVHPGAPELHEVRPPRHRVPQVAVAPRRLRASPVRRRRVPRRRQGLVLGIRRRLARQEPHAVAHVPPLQGRVPQRHLQDDEPRVQDNALLVPQLHSRHLLVTIPGEGLPTRPVAPHVEHPPRRAGRGLGDGDRRLRPGHHLGGQLVHPPGHLLRGRPRGGLPLLPRPWRPGPHPPALAPHGVPRRAPSSPRPRGVPWDGDRADAVADVPLRGRRVGPWRRLPPDAAAERDADGGAGPGLPHGAGGGVRRGQGGAEKGGGEEDGVDGHYAGDGAAAGRAPEQVRALGAREGDAVQRLHPLVFAWAHRRLERDAAPDAPAAAGPFAVIHAAASSS